MVSPIGLAGIVSVGCFLLPGCGGSGEGDATTDRAELQAAESAGPNDPGSTTELSRDQQLDRADQLVESEQWDSASNLLREMLLVDPQDVEVLFRLANVSAATGKLSEGIEFLDLIPSDDLEAGLPALGQSADWCLQLERYSDAERRYREILNLAPDAAIAHRRIALLLNRQGRRHEAAVHIRELCKIGDVRQEELHALIVLSDAMTSESEPPVDPLEDYRSIGESGRARALFTERRYAEAADVLADAIRTENPPPAVLAFYGRVLAEAQRDDELRQWIGSLADEKTVREFSEYWSALGIYLANQKQYEPAARAFLEALDRDATDFRSMNRLYQMLKLLDQPEQADLWEKRWNATKKVLLANNEIVDSSSPNVTAMDEIASQLSGLGRNIEAVLWKSVEAYHRQATRDVFEHWNNQRMAVIENGTDFPNQSVRICGMKLASYSTPDLSSLRDEATVRSTAGTSNILKATAASFRNISEDVGLAHRYELATKPLASGFSMYHQAGGGVAVIDFDLDGSSDLYFAQGAAEPPSFVAKASNVLLRNVDGRLVEVTEAAQVVDRRYTIGCSAGDWNQDGFPDLITANIGANQLLINNGDGTFSPIDLPGSQSLERMPASIALADVNGDALPDVVELNYIDDPQIAMLPERDSEGRVIEAVGPADFSPANDRVGINDGRGGMSFFEFTNDPETVYRGLGVVVADFNGNGTNDIFVGNDKSPNQLWVHENESTEWSDVAMIAGAAYSFDGGGTASMGIAAGDFDHSGTIDLHVTNFQNENACLYLSKEGFFQDRAAQFRLGVPSYQVLGFGSQAIDYDNNGWLDLAVTNGHIDDYLKMSGPFRQRAQLFANLGNRFEGLAVADSSGYWDADHLGRAMARLDFDRDGRNDLVVTHVNETSALLINETDSKGHWLQLKLVGVEAERDAVGATVTLEARDFKRSAWVTGGDGYLCRNEAIVSFGLGSLEALDRVQIQWPNGELQTLRDIDVDRRYLVIENGIEAFELAR
ncbi:MAG: FG-GAP-like repeat-containing protein [Planctomycetota bacterium]